METKRILWRSSLSLLLLMGPVFHGKTNGEDQMAPPDRRVDATHKCACGDENFRSECCGPDGCVLAGLCNDGCCGKVCRATVEQVTEERSCWKIGCEEICVPRVVCPWSAGGSGLTILDIFKKSHTCSSSCRVGCGLPQRCGDIRCVRVLESVDYEVTKCKCKWDVGRCTSCYGPGGDCRFGDNGGDGCGCGCGLSIVSGPHSTTAFANGMEREAIARTFATQRAFDDEPAHPQSDRAAANQTPTTVKQWWRWWK
jgi:hypothetical protein